MKRPGQNVRAEPPLWRSGALAVLALTALAMPGASALATSREQGQASVSVPRSLANTPIRFEKVGNEQVFFARGFNYEFCLQPTRATLVVRKPLAPPAQPGTNPQRALILPGRQDEIRSVTMSFAGADPKASMVGLEPVPGTVNYIVGDDSARWRIGNSSFGRVTVRGLYAGIDLVYYGNQRQLEYDFIVAPGANPDSILIRFEGTDDVCIGSNGELVLTIGPEKVTHPRPALFQWKDGVRRHVSGGYRLLGPTEVGFTIGEYDCSMPLVIDPVLSYATLFGGNAGDLALSVKLDSQGFIYVAGETLSTSFPVPISGFDTNFGGGKFNGDAFVAKFDPTASTLVYFTYLGGSGNDGALDLAVDSAGHAHVCGFTDSPNFPTRNALYPRIKGTPTPDQGIYHMDAFIAELDASGQGLTNSTYFGGTNTDRADAIALDPSGATYITGVTYSPELPLSNPLPGQNVLHGPYDAFVAKFGPGGAPLIYSTFLGGTNADEGQGIAADANGAAYVTGLTSSTNFPVTPGAFRTNLNGYQKLTPLYDAFVTKISPEGGSLAYSTLLGGSNTDSGFRIAVDASGNALVTGSTLSLDFPNTATNLGLAVGFTNIAFASDDCFLSKFTPEGSLAWSVRFGGSFPDVGWDIALDAAGDPFVLGTTSSTNFPVFNEAGFPAPRKARLGYESIFLTAVKADASAVLYSLTMGGTNNDRGYGITVDPAGNAYIVGNTTSTNFPVLNAYQTSKLGTNDTFIAKIAVEPVLQTALSGNAIQLKWRAFAPEYALESATSSTESNSWSPVAETVALTNGWHTVTVGATNAGTFFRLRGAERP